MEVLTTILLVAIVVGIGALLILILRRSAGRQDPLQGASFFQQQLDTLRSEVAASLKHTTETVNQHLQVVTTQLSSVTQQLQTNTGQMGQRLDNAARVIQEVQGKLGELGKATQEIKELGQSVSKLEEMLRAPKLRGGLGELLLEDLLKQVLPANAYSIQHRFRSGELVDAIIRTAGGIVPVDSKFPLENFRKMVEAKSEQEKKVAARTFVADVKKHVDAIAAKYIRPDEGTFDFALMYIPAENIYYETIIREESFADDTGLYEYATRKRVVPVSPNSFYAHLRVIALGLKGLEIEKSAKEIFQNLQRLGNELQKFTDLFETLGLHLTNAKNNYDKADKQLNSFTERLKSLHSPEKEGEDHTQLSLLSGGQE